MTFVPKNPAMLSRARELRRDMTPQERHLWYDFLKDYPVKVYKQRIIESFIADFYCSSALLVIELDGSQHFTAQGIAYDQERSAIFETYGIQVLRFTNREIDTQFEAVCSQIAHVIACRREMLSRQPK
jgi:very-short-patch-repair endonuclease